MNKKTFDRLVGADVCNEEYVAIEEVVKRVHKIANINGYGLGDCGYFFLNEESYMLQEIIEKFGYSRGKKLGKLAADYAEKLDEYGILTFNT